jgi:cytochrome c biogenesis protein CcdA
VDIGFVAAVVGGVLALLSPCSALLLPSFFAYAFRDAGRLLVRTAVFYLGLCLTLVPLGAGSALVSVLFYGHRETLVTVAGSLIIVLGVVQILGLGFSFGVFSRAQGKFAGGRGNLSVLGLGSVYGLAGFCSGPILGAVLTVAATGTPVRGMLLMAAYGLGMALPMFLLALLWDRFDLGRKGWLRGRSLKIGPVHTHTTALVSGTLFILIGVFFLAFDGTASITALPGAGWMEGVALSAQEPLSRLGGTTDLIAVAVLVLVISLSVGGTLLARSRSRTGGAAPEEEHDRTG